jgi:toluene monooxygenase system protein B
MSETTITEQQNPAGQAAAAGEPSLIPLNALFADDFLQILVPVMSNQTVGDLADAVAQHAEGIRVPPRDRPKVVFHEGREVPPELTVAEAGIAPLDHVTVDYAS